MRTREHRERKSAAKLWQIAILHRARRLGPGVGRELSTVPLDAGRPRAWVRQSHSRVHESALFESSPCQAPDWMADDKASSQPRARRRYRVTNLAGMAFLLRHCISAAASDPRIDAT
jgi:hypothetical protein